MCPFSLAKYYWNLCQFKPKRRLHKNRSLVKGLVISVGFEDKERKKKGSIATNSGGNFGLQAIKHL